MVACTGLNNDFVNICNGRDRGCSFELRGQ